MLLDFGIENLAEEEVEKFKSACKLRKIYRHYRGAGNQQIHN